MNNDIIKGHWKELKGKVRQQWADLTDDDVAKMQGTYEELEGKLQKTYGYDKDRIKDEIEKFVTRSGFADEVTIKTETDPKDHH